MGLASSATRVTNLVLVVIFILSSFATITWAQYEQSTCSGFTISSPGNGSVLYSQERSVFLRGTVSNQTECPTILFQMYNSKGVFTVEGVAFFTSTTGTNFIGPLGDNFPYDTYTVYAVLPVANRPYEKPSPFYQITFTLAACPPAVITSPSADNYVFHSNSSITFRGTSTCNPLQFTIDSGQSTFTGGSYTGYSDPSGSWSFTIPSALGISASLLTGPANTFSVTPASDSSLAATRSWYYNPACPKPTNLFAPGAAYIIGGTFPVFGFVTIPNDIPASECGTAYLYLASSGKIIGQAPSDSGEFRISVTDPSLGQLSPQDTYIRVGQGVRQSPPSDTVSIIFVNGLCAQATVSLSPLSIDGSPTTRTPTFSVQSACRDVNITLSGPDASGNTVTYSTQWHNAVSGDGTWTVPAALSDGIWTVTVSNQDTAGALLPAYDATYTFSMSLKCPTPVFDLSSAPQPLNFTTRIPEFTGSGGRAPIRSDCNKVTIYQEKVGPGTFPWATITLRYDGYFLFQQSPQSTGAHTIYASIGTGLNQSPYARLDYTILSKPCPAPVSLQAAGNLTTGDRTISAATSTNPGGDIDYVETFCSRMQFSLKGLSFGATPPVTSFTIDSQSGTFKSGIYTFPDGVYQLTAYTIDPNAGSATMSATSNMTFTVQRLDSCPWATIDPFYPGTGDTPPVTTPLTNHRLPISGNATSFGGCEVITLSIVGVVPPNTLVANQTVTTTAVNSRYTYVPPADLPDGRYFVVVDSGLGKIRSHNPNFQGFELGTRCADPVLTSVGTQMYTSGMNYVGSSSPVLAGSYDSRCPLFEITNVKTSTALQGVVMVNAASSTFRFTPTAPYAGEGTVSLTILSKGNSTASGGLSPAPASNAVPVSFLAWASACAPPTSIVSPANNEVVVSRSPPVRYTVSSSTGDCTVPVIRFDSNLVSVDRIVSNSATDKTANLLALTLADGAHTLTVGMSSTSGRPPASVLTRTFTVGASDCLAPAISYPGQNEVISSTTPTFTGTASTAPGCLAGLTITIVQPGSRRRSTLNIPITPTAGTWSYTLLQGQALSPGPGTMTVTSKSLNGNTAQTDPVPFTVIPPSQVSGGVTPPHPRHLKRGPCAAKEDYCRTELPFGKFRYECVQDVQYNLERCGSCDGPDCGELPNVDSVACVDGECVISECLYGYELHDNACRRTLPGLNATSVASGTCLSTRHSGRERKCRFRAQ